MSCSSASQSVPRRRSSAASPFSSFRPQVSPGSIFFNSKSLPLAMRNGWVYFWMRSRISCRGMVQLPSLEAALGHYNRREAERGAAAVPEALGAAANLQIAIDSGASADGPASGGADAGMPAAKSGTGRNDQGASGVNVD